MASSERIHLVVLFGGQSAEHDVSCTTAAHVLAAADPAKYRVTPIGISTEGEWALAQGALDALEAGPQALPDRLDPSGPSLSPTPMLAEATAGTELTVVLPLLHGPMGEDGTVQGMLELANVAFVGSGVLGSARRDGQGDGQAGAGRQRRPAGPLPGVRRPRAHAGPPRAARRGARAAVLREARQHGFVGRRHEGRDVEQLRDAIEYALTYDEWVVVEEAVVGREIEVAVLGNTDPRPRSPARSSPATSSTATRTSTSPTAPSCSCRRRSHGAAMDEVRALAVRVFALLRCEGLARVDFFYEEGGRGFLCNEVNTMPGFTPISMYPKLWLHSGMTYSELIDRLVELALERHARRRRNTKH